MLSFPCGHSHDVPTTIPTMQEAASRCHIVDGRADQEWIDKTGNPVDARACTLPGVLVGAPSTRIARDFWVGLAPAQRIAVVAHETSHRVLGLAHDCELCCDALGGFLIACWGFTPEYARDAVGGVVSTRPDAAQAAYVGAQYGGRHLARMRVDRRNELAAAAAQARGLEAPTVGKQPASDTEAAIERAKEAAKATSLRLQQQRDAAEQAAKESARAKSDARDAQVEAAKESAKAKVKAKSAGSILDAPEGAAPGLFDGLGREVVVGLVVAVIVAVVIGSSSA